jgi:hypothetical protein
MKALSKLARTTVWMILAVVVLTGFTVLACTYVAHAKAESKSCETVDASGTFNVSDSGRKIKAVLSMDGVDVDSAEKTTTSSSKTITLSWTGSASVGSHTITVIGYEWAIKTAESWGPWESGHGSGSDVQNQHKHSGGSWQDGTCSGSGSCTEQHRHKIPAVWDWVERDRNSDTVTVSSCAPVEHTIIFSWSAGCDAFDWNLWVDGVVSGYQSVWSNPFLTETYSPIDVSLPVEKAGEIYKYFINGVPATRAEISGLVIQEPDKCLLAVTTDQWNHCDSWERSAQLVWVNTGPDGQAPGSGASSFVIVDSGTYDPFQTDKSQPSFSGNVTFVDGPPWGNGTFAVSFAAMGTPSDCPSHTVFVYTNVVCEGAAAQLFVDGEAVDGKSMLFIDPYTPEHMDYSFTDPRVPGENWVIDSGSAPFAGTLYEPEDCTRHQVAGVKFEKTSCGPNGSTYTFTFPENGIAKIVLTKGPDVVTLTGSGPVLLAGGTWSGQAYPAEGYDINPPEAATFTITSTVCETCSWNPTGRLVWVNYMNNTDPLHYGFWVDNGIKVGVCTIWTWDGNPPTLADQIRLCGCQMPATFVWHTDQQMGLQEVRNSCTGEIRLWNGYEFVTPFGGWNPNQRACSASECPNR